MPNTMETTIGLYAGKIWEYLTRHPKVDVMKLKFELNITSSVLFMAVGWLAREDKISLTQDKNTLFIGLKK